jgi:hypothetical protein
MGRRLGTAAVLPWTTGLPRRPRGLLAMVKMGGQECTLHGAKTDQVKERPGAPAGREFPPNRIPAKWKPRRGRGLPSPVSAILKLKDYNLQGSGVARSNPWVADLERRFFQS